MDGTWGDYLTLVAAANIFNMGITVVSSILTFYRNNIETLSKLIEKFMQIHLMHYLNTFDVLHKFQSDFRSGHSTETALTLMTESWLKAINDGNIVGTIMVDFRKAFDLVDHDLLLHTLSLYRCGADFIRLMTSYLKSRSQVVSLHGKQSSSCKISSGVPQGSILGPLLFFVFINDLPLVLSYKISAVDLFADDTQLFMIFNQILRHLSQIYKNHFLFCIDGVGKMECF